MRRPTGRTGTRFGLAALACLAVFGVTVLSDLPGVHSSFRDGVEIVTALGAALLGFVGFVASVRALLLGGRPVRGRALAGLLLSLPSLVLLAWIALLIYILFTSGFE